MPLVNKTFSDIITFTRASTATYFDSAGVLQSAAIDTPRFDYDPATLAARGLLIEEQRTNLLTYSEQFDDAAWTKDRINTTGTPPWVNVEVAPDGATSADKLIEDTDPGTHYLAQNVTVVDATTYTVSFFAKAAERNRFRIRFGTNLGGGTFLGSADFDLLAGTVSATSGITDSSITPVGNGWYRCTATDVSSGTTLGIGVFLISSGTTTSYTGDGTSGLYVWGAQLEEGAFPTSYIPTTTTALTRSADVASVNTLSPWFNASEGTLFAQAEVPSVVLASRNMAGIGRATPTAYEIQLSISRSSDSRRIAVINAGTNQLSYAPPGTATSSKGAVAYKTDDSQGAFDGTASSVDTSVTLPTALAALYLGNDDGGNLVLNGWLKRVTYYPRRLSQAELEAITS